MLSMLDRDRTVAGRGYRRWLIPPAALAVHLSIGQVYAFSVFKEPLVEHFGTKLTPISIIFSISIVMLGLSAAVGGTWVELRSRGGPTVTTNRTPRFQARSRRAIQKRSGSYDSWIASV